MLRMVTTFGLSLGSDIACSLLLEAM